MCTYSYTRVHVLVHARMRQRVRNAKCVYWRAGARLHVHGWMHGGMDTWINYALIK